MGRRRVGGAKESARAGGAAGPPRATMKTPGDEGSLSMSRWNELAHFLYGDGFWYADPIREIHGIAEEDLFATPDPGGLCILWHVGHVAHRERLHFEHIIQGADEDGLMPPEYDVFGAEWVPAEEVRAAIGSVQEVLEWVRDVRIQSHQYIASLTEEAYHRPAANGPPDLTVAHWVFLTVSHGALHIGRIQLLRNAIAGRRDNPC